jgi:hypothetical protein
MAISRRNFLMGGATVATLASLPSALSAAQENPVVDPSSDGISFARSARGIRINCSNGIVLDFVLKGKRLQGIGAVSYRGKASPG